jgi:hypothetical protein
LFCFLFVLFFVLFPERHSWILKAISQCWFWICIAKMKLIVPSDMAEVRESSHYKIFKTYKSLVNVN